LGSEDIRITGQQNYDLLDEETNDKTLDTFCGSRDTFLVGIC
jgi:hypothetical protein